MNVCAPQTPQARRRPFWATQPDACGDRTNGCGQPCPIPGLAFVDQAGGRTFDTQNWIRGLILNILNTERRVDDSFCGTTPAAVKGHWSESFIDANMGLYGGATRGYRVGSSLLQLDTSGLRTTEAIALIQASLSRDLQKLVTLGVATGVTVEVIYRGSQRVEATITVEGPSIGPDNRVALLGTASADMGYFWSI